jgi:hypothetical protein
MKPPAWVQNGAARAMTWLPRGRWGSASSRACCGGVETSLAGDPAGFDAALAELSRRVERIAPRLAAIS